VTVHMISVGLSMLDTLRDPYGKLAGERDLIAMINRGKPLELLPDDTDRGAASDWLAGALAAEGNPGRDAAAADRVRAVCAAVQPNRWPRHMSAEVETFSAVPGTGFPLRADDIAVLICSDTPLGLLAGLWNALALTDGQPGRVRYLPDPGSMLAGGRGHAVLVRVPGMDAGSPEGFRQAMGGLGLLARYLFQYGQLAKAEEFRFYLSGGFKAAIPYLIGLAEAVRSIDETRLRSLHAQDVVPDQWPYPVQAFVLHETAGPGAPPIRLPLRMLVAEAIRDELADFGKDGKLRGELSRDLLLGYAYEAAGEGRAKSYALTAFGEGLRALFGVTPEGPQG
jgi:hypothetical protein